MIKVDLITGFLGSGKTTFIKEYASYLVKRGENVAIIVNDYGAINVDRLLLGDALGDSCHLEMVIGGDADCTRRRLKTKLIAMAMIGYTYVIVEPSGIFDVDDFLDMLYEEPLERWYEMGSIISLVDADIDRTMSDEARYIMTSEVAKAGTVVLSKVNSNINQSQIESVKNDVLSYINESLDLYKCSRHVDDLYIWKLGQISDEDFDRISHSRYTSGEMVKLAGIIKQSEDHETGSNSSHFDSLFFFHVKTDISKIKETISQIFMDSSAGNVVRLKGFIQEDNGNWLEVNATKFKVNIEPISTGQELFIVIGENLDEKVIGGYWDSYRNGL